MKMLFISTALYLGSVFSTHAYDEQQIKLGNYLDQEIIGREVVLQNERLTKTIQNFADDLLKQCGITETCTITILNNPVVNAYAVPAGHLYVTTGLLDFVQSKDELAMIIAHEMAHALENHSIEHWKSVHRTRATVQFVGGVAAGVAGPLAGMAVAGATAAGSLVSGAVGGVIGAGQALAEIGILTSYSRSQEEEADKLAVKYVAKSKYEPRKMIDFLKRLQGTYNSWSEVDRNRYVSKLINAKPGLSNRIQYLEAACAQPAK